MPVDAPLTLTLFNAFGLSRHTLAVGSTTGLAPAPAPELRAHVAPPSPRIPSPPERRLPPLARDRLAPTLDLSRFTPKE